MLEFVVKLAQKLRIVPILFVGCFQLVQGVDQRFSDKRTTKLTKMSIRVGQGIGFQSSLS